MKGCRRISFLVWTGTLLAFLVACSHDIRLRPGLTPISAGRRSPLRVALLIDPAIKTHVDSGKPNSPNFTTAMSSFSFQVGEALAPLLEKSAEGTFRKVSVVSSVPSAAAAQQMGVDGTLQIKLAGSNLALDAQPGLFSQAMRTNYEISLRGLFFDRLGRQIFATTARASSFSTQNQGLFSAGQKEFSPAVEKAVREVAGTLIDQVVSSAEVIRYGNRLRRRVIK